MKIDKAIKILQGTATQDLKREFSDIYDAQKLGIEALKRIYLQREHPKRKFNTLLSGETIETT